MRSEQELDGVSLLGNTGVKYPTQYAPEVLETFVNKHPDNEYLVTFTCPEFTSLCPKTGQPDFAKIIISYIPREKMVESNIIMKDLIALMDPRYIEVKGIFTPRGGIAILPFANHGDSEHQDMARRRMLDSFPSDL